MANLKTGCLTFPSSESTRKYWHAWSSFVEICIVVFEEVIFVKFSYFLFNYMLACFVLSQRLKTRKLFETNFTLLCILHSRCCMFHGNVIIQTNLWGCWKVGTLGAIKFSSWTPRLVSYSVLLCSLCPTFITCNFLLAVQSRHYWSFLSLLSKQNNLKMYCFNQIESSNARKIMVVKL